MNRLAIAAALVLPVLAVSSIAQAHPSDSKSSKSSKISVAQSHPKAKYAPISWSTLDRHPTSSPSSSVASMQALMTFNPAFAVAQFWMKASVQMWSTSMAMMSPLGYGAMRGPLGY